MEVYSEKIEVYCWENAGKSGWLNHENDGQNGDLTMKMMDNMVILPRKLIGHIVIFYGDFWWLNQETWKNSHDLSKRNDGKHWDFTKHSMVYHDQVDCWDEGGVYDISN